MKLTIPWRRLVAFIDTFVAQEDVEVALGKSQHCWTLEPALSFGEADMEDLIEVIPRKHPRWKQSLYVKARNGRMSWTI